METSSAPTGKIHQGRNVKRFREMLGIKQEALAYELGEDWSQKRVSLLEAREVIEPTVLHQLSDVLKIPVEAFQNLNDEQAVNIISNTVNNSDNATGNSLYNHYPTFNPIDKLVEVFEENKQLYERLLESEREKNALLERLLEQKSL